MGSRYLEVESDSRYNWSRNSVLGFTFPGVIMLISLYVLVTLATACGLWFLWKGPSRISPFLLTIVFLCGGAAVFIYVAFVLDVSPIWQKFLILVAPLAFLTLVFIIRRFAPVTATDFEVEPGR